MGNMHKTEGAEGILRRQIVDLLTGVASPAGETASEWHRGCHSEAVKNLLAQGPSGLLRMDLPVELEGYYQAP